MKLSFTCVTAHDEPHPLATRSARVELEQGRCPVCTDEPLDGMPYGGLEGARCPCCHATWRLEDDGFSVRSGQLVEEWT